MSSPNSKRVKIAEPASQQDEAVRNYANALAGYLQHVASQSTGASQSDNSNAAVQGTPQVSFPASFPMIPMPTPGGASSNAAGAGTTNANAQSMPSMMMMPPWMHPYGMMPGSNLCSKSLLKHMNARQ